MSGYRYRFYPSLLDRFQSYLDAGIDAEAFWNTDADGNPKMTEEELATQRGRELLDAVNRVPTPTTEAQATGTVFNEIVDLIIANETVTERDDMEVMLDDRTGLWHASHAGFNLSFAHQLCAEVAERIGGMSVPQMRLECGLPTERGLVQLYGYADEIVPDKIIDIKTTSSYTFGKYERRWQKLLYPYCLMQSGLVEYVKSFDYIVVQLYRPTQTRPFIDGKVYSEEYTYDHEYARDRLTGICTMFADWLEAHRDVITDKKIFGGDEGDKQQ